MPQRAPNRDCLGHRERRICLDCKHFGVCGSCSLYKLDYNEQLSKKKEKVESLLSPYYSGELEVFDSPAHHYRARAEFRIWHEGERCSYAMGNLKKNGVVLIDECPKVIEAIERRMWRLLELINASEVLRKKLFGVEFLATTTDECLITMLYHRRLEEGWESEARLLQELLCCKIIGRSKGQKTVLAEEFVTERLLCDGKETLYRQYESGFTQPNPAVNIKMIEWALEQAKKADEGDFLESYCGLGNFTLPISHYFQKVLATEVSKRSITAAEENCLLNKRANISFVRLSSEEMTQALQKIRPFRRLNNIDIDKYTFTAVLVDPPRAGLDLATIGLISAIDMIIYISCNPETLARDLQSLTLTHNIENGAIFDQFPYSDHIESALLLRRVPPATE